MNHLEEAYSMLGTWNDVDMISALAAGGLLIFIVLLVLGFTLHKSKKVPGEDQMNKEEYQKVLLSRRVRRRRVNRLVGDKIGDALLTLYANGDLDDEEYRTYIRRLSRHFKDFIPRKLTKSQLKVAIQRRLNSDIYKPVKLPDPNKIKKMSVLDKLLAPHYASKQS